jgi:hypothetical protein
VQVPDALVRQFYVANSLRNTADGWALEAQNPMGDGTIVGVGPIRVDGRDIDLDDIAAEVVTPGADAPAAPIAATGVDRYAPLRFRRGDRLVLRVRGAPLEPGGHELDVRLIELNLGALHLRIRDTIAG